MKDFFKKHTVIFTLGIIFIALFTNLTTGFFQSFFPENQMMYFLVEAIFKFGVSVVLLILMVKHGYTKKADKKNIAIGFALSSILLLLMFPNVIPFILVNPILFDIQWGTLFAIIFAAFSIGLMEETAIRGVLLPTLCEKWKDKKHFYLKAALASSLLFGFVHLTWSVRYLLTHGYLPLSELLGNLYQVFFAFCFGLFAAGITIYTRNILSIVLVHGLWDLPHFIIYGIVPYASAKFYERQGTLNLHGVFYKYGIFPEFPYAANLIFYLIDLLFVIIGIILILKAEKKYLSK